MDLVEYGLQSVVNGMDMGSSGLGCEHLDLDPNSDAPIVIMGKTFNLDDDETTLRCVLSSRLWFSYRRNFPALGQSELRSDRGFGCMMRCGQMVLAEALLRLKLGTRWQWKQCQEDPMDNHEYRDILRAFLDTPKAPYSIHQICLASDKPIGQWMGPNTIAHVLKRLVSHSVTTSLVVHVAMDTAIRRSVIISECRTKTTDVFRPLLLFVPLRLGLTEINPIYFTDLKTCLEMPQSLGVIGGRPNHALYFVGFQDDQLIFLDPHVTQEAIVNLEDLDEIKNENDDKTNGEGDRRSRVDASFHTDSFGRIHMCHLDPSLSLAFYCHSESQFEDLCDKLHTQLVQGHTRAMLEVCRDEQGTFESHLVDDAASKGQSDDEDDFEIL